MREKKEKLAIYAAVPPKWLPKAHVSADIGYPGFHPPRLGRDEDALTTANIKHGYILNHAVGAETFSAQSTMSDALRSTDVVSKLEELMDELFIRRANNIPPIPPPAFRIPSRVTLNDSKRQSWFADLANPNVPLHRLGKNVPHGAKGHDLLDQLHANSVAIPRAVWVLRVFGANETAGLRNKPSYNPTQYSVEWTNVVTSYMKKQLAEVILPSAPRPGLNIKSTFKGVLADLDSREKWTSRFAYCLDLLKTFYHEGLVDKRTFLVWVVQQMVSCNMAQAAFITRLANEYLEDMVASRALVKPFLEGCLTKLSELQSTVAQDVLIDTGDLLVSIVQRLCQSFPDAFISPRLWVNYSELVTVTLGSNFQDIYHTSQVGSLTTNFMSIKRRNDAMLFQNLPVLQSASLGSVVSDVELLNSISIETEMKSVDYFQVNPESNERFSDKVKMLLTWSVTPLQFGDHRPHAAVTLLHYWRSRASERAARRECKSPDDLLQDCLFDWLDDSEEAAHADNLQAVVILFGELVKRELFSYAGYIQRLIARGEQGLSFAEAQGSRHRKFLRCIPLVMINSTSALVSQRRVTLYGARAREIPEDSAERAIRQELRLVLPDVFGGIVSDTPSSTALLSQCPELMSATRFEHDRIFRAWLLPLLRKRVLSLELDTATIPAFLQTFCIATELMSQTKCFQSLLDFTLYVLEHCCTADVLTPVINTLHQYSAIWAAMDVIDAIVTDLHNAHQLWKSRRIQSRPLLNLLVELDDSRHLDPAARSQILLDIHAYTLTLQPIAAIPDIVPDVLPEILFLHGDLTPDAPSILANSLWIKYRTSADWAWKVWDNTIASLRQIPSITSNASERNACALRYGTFLWHVDQHLPTGLDDQVLKWFLGRGQNEISALHVDVWEILSIMILHLCIHGALKTMTVMEGLVYPVWRLFSASRDALPPVVETSLRSANALSQQLLFEQEDCHLHLNLMDIQSIRARRVNVYQEPHFPLLVASIPVLVGLENNVNVLPEGRQAARSLRRALCEVEDFRRAVYRNLSTVREAFERPFDAACPDLTKATTSALRRVLCETSADIELSYLPDSVSLLSPWTISATTIRMQFLLRHMGATMANDTQAAAGLDKLTSMLFHQSLSSGEAYFVAQMAKGVGAAVTAKFINSGLDCILSILADDPMHQLDEAQLLDRLGRSGEVLRVMMYIVEPLRANPSHLPFVETKMQDRFFGALCIRLDRIHHSEPKNAKMTNGITQALVLFLRLLQFDLGLQGVWTNEAKQKAPLLCKTLFYLAMRCAQEDDVQTFSIILDTLYYLMDESTADDKSGDIYSHYPDMRLSDLPTNMPPTCRERLRALLPDVSPAAAIANISSGHRAPSGNLVVNGPIVNRPWEWIENLGEPDISDKLDTVPSERVSAAVVVKNTGSLPLEAFEARSTGVGSLQPGVSSDRLIWNALMFEDTSAATNVFLRDCQEARVDVDVVKGSSKTTISDEVPGSAGGSSRSEKRTPRGSPGASSAMSRHSMRQSPALSVGRHTSSTVSEVIDVDNLDIDTGQRAKRKAPMSIDDEIEILDGPMVSSSRGGKKIKVDPALKVTGKGKGRKR